MKITINYQRGFGSFLDEKNIPFFNNGDDTITFSVTDAKHAFELAMEFCEWKLDNLTD